MKILTLLALLGVVTATGRAQTRPSTPVPTLKATIDLTIGGGADEARDEYQFAAIGGLATDKSGQIYVAEAETNIIRVYSAAGKYVYTIGQKGQGPGDLMQPLNIAFDETGRLWVKEGRNHRFSVFVPALPKAKFVRSIRAEASSMYGSSDRVHWDLSGRVIDFRTAQTRPGEAWRLMRLFLDTLGNIGAVDSVPPIAKDSMEQWTFKRPNGSMAMYKPFGANRIQAFGGRGMAAFATNTNYAVSLVDEHGKRVALLRQTVSPVGLSKAELKKVDEQKEAIAKNNGVPVGSLAFDIPQTKPALVRLGFDVDGRLWVERAVADGAPHTADVYDATRKQLATMQWPADVQLRDGAVSGRGGLGVQVDPDGVQRVVRLVWK